MPVHSHVFLEIVFFLKARRFTPCIYCIEMLFTIPSVKVHITTIGLLPTFLCPARVRKSVTYSYNVHLCLYLLYCLVFAEIPGITHPTHTNASYDNGSVVNISCTATGKPDPDVRWTYNGQKKSSGSKTAHLLFSPISKADAGTYICMANNSAGNTEKQLDIFVNCKYR